jgi:hypothetical protein
VVWGLLFAVYDGLTRRPSPWLKGIIFGVFAWWLMMITFLPLPGAGFFGSKIDISAKAGLLVLHLIYGTVLGATYGLLGTLRPVKVALVHSPQNLSGIDDDKLLRMRAADYSFNDDLPSTSPSARTMFMIFASLVGFFVLVWLAVTFRSTFGF